MNLLLVATRTPNPRTAKCVIDFQGSFLAMQDDVLFLSAIPHMCDGTDLDASLCTVREFDGQESRVIGRVWHGTISTRAFHESGKPPADFGNIAHKPPCQIDHMR